MAITAHVAGLAWTSLALAQRPNLATGLEHLLANVHLAGTFGLCDGSQFCQILRAAIAKAHGAAIAVNEELDFEVSLVPSSLRFIAVAVNHAQRLPASTDTGRAALRETTGIGLSSRLETLSLSLSRSPTSFVPGS